MPTVRVKLDPTLIAALRTIARSCNVRGDQAKVIERAADALTGVPTSVACAHCGRQIDLPHHRQKFCDANCAQLGNADRRRAYMRDLMRRRRATPEAHTA